MKSENKKSEKCIFCNYEMISEGLLDETENFYLRAACRGAVAPGHTLLISKDHLSCFGEMQPSLYTEYSYLVDKIEKEIENIFGKQIMSEQGIHGQSVNHAHLHFLPCVSEWYDFTKDKSFVDLIPKEILVTQGRDISDICRVFKEEGQYVSIQENEELYICHTRDYEINHDGYLQPTRAFPAELTGIMHLLHWQTMPESEKAKNEKWIQETIQKLKALSILS